MNRSSLFVLMMINVPMYIGVGKLFFKSWGDFKAGLIALYRRRYEFFGFGWDHMDDQWSELKTFFYIILCLTLTIGEVYYLMHR